MISKFSAECSKITSKLDKETRSLYEANGGYELGKFIGKTISKGVNWYRYAFQLKKFIALCQRDIKDLERRCAEYNKGGSMEQYLDSEGKPIIDTRTNKPIYRSGSNGPEFSFEHDVELTRDTIIIKDKINKWLAIVQQFIWLKAAKTRKAELEVLLQRLEKVRSKCGNKQQQPTPPITYIQGEWEPPEYVPSYTHRTRPAQIANRGVVPYIPPNRLR